MAVGKPILRCIFRQLLVWSVKHSLVKGSPKSILNLNLYLSFKREL